MDHYPVLNARHGEKPAAGSTMKPYWGYPSRELPCPGVPNQCEYLDAVWWMHSRAMLFSLILWAILGGLLVFFLVSRVVKPARSRNAIVGFESGKTAAPMGTWARLWKSNAATGRKFLLPESMHSVFGNVTRLQLLLLAVLLVYLLVFSKNLLTPVKGTTSFSRRTGLGGFSNRLGVFANALTIFQFPPPLVRAHHIFSVDGPHNWLDHHRSETLSATTESLQRFRERSVAMAMISFIWVFSFPAVIKKTGYEFFRKTHCVVALVYIGACWGHWARLSCWMIASLAVIFLDFGIRYLRTILIHTGYTKSGGYGFESAQATLQSFDDQEGRVVRVDFKHNHGPWHPGQHFYLTFPTLSVWQNHPFTVASLPSALPAISHHTYIIRCLNGETSKLGQLALKIEAEKTTTPVILSGPYGPPSLCEPGNMLLIAGGTGITMAHPLFLSRAQQLRGQQGRSSGKVQLVWIIRRIQDLEWMGPELSILKQYLSKEQDSLSIRIFVTREVESTIYDKDSKESSEEDGATEEASSSSNKSQFGHVSNLVRKYPGFEVQWLGDHHPDLGQVVTEFVEGADECAGSVSVVGSGPRGMGTSLRAGVAHINDGARVSKGEEKYDVHLHWDDRHD
ncbi:related to ferric reductase FRE2 precursor [Rhynchosporium graminicola]|uniref:Related to ferric reductase FRE2 n=1 Tax=Rhynchosporium graminicola TaxID=2792576 RepID=A0A1E1JXQ5_9HELO|nr:related to ferric reductase FRE2 precursor [Rhynchosporium commune]